MKTRCLQCIENGQVVYQPIQFYVLEGWAAPVPLCVAHAPLLPPTPVKELNK